MGYLWWVTLKENTSLEHWGKIVETWQGPKLDNAMDTVTYVEWPKGVRKLKGLVQCRGSVDWNACKDKMSCLRATVRSLVKFSKTAWLASFNFFPHPDRWIPLFYLKRFRITHARYHWNSVSSSSFI